MRSLRDSLSACVLISNFALNKIILCFWVVSEKRSKEMKGFYDISLELKIYYSVN